MITLKKTTKKTDEKNEDRQSMRWLGYGVEFIGVLGIFTYMGYMADEKFKTTPWLMLTGLLVSFIGMIYLLIKETKDWQ